MEQKQKKSPCLEMIKKLTLNKHTNDKHRTIITISHFIGMLLRFHFRQFDKFEGVGNETEGVNNKIGGVK